MYNAELILGGPFPSNYNNSESYICIDGACGVFNVTWHLNGMSVLTSDDRVKINDMDRRITVNLTLIENGTTLQCFDYNISCEPVERQSNIRTLNGQLNPYLYHSRGYLASRNLIIFF